MSSFVIDKSNRVNVTGTVCLENNYFVEAMKHCFKFFLFKLPYFQCLCVSCLTASALASDLMVYM